MKNVEPSETIQAHATCRICGVLLEQSGRHYFDAFLPDQVASFSAAGRAKMVELRATGKDRAVGGNVAKRRAAKLKQRMAEQDAWEAEHGTEGDPQVFRRKIMPKLARMSLAAMAKATGLSVQYCSLI